MNYFVLVEIDGVEKTVLGVFSGAHLPENVLAEYYGDCSTDSIVDIRDSGIEWRMRVTHSTGHVILTMMEFVLDEIRADREAKRLAELDVEMKARLEEMTEISQKTAQYEADKKEAERIARFYRNKSAF